MTTLLHIDASARFGGSDTNPHGSHTRRLTARFVQQWMAVEPGAKVIYRDVGQEPPSPVSGRWIHAAFTPEREREAWMQEVLRVSDALVDELLQADLIVAGVPMYNFGPPAQFKAYIDNIVRVGRTFGFDRSRSGDPYWPLLENARKRLVILSARRRSRIRRGTAPGRTQPCGGLRADSLCLYGCNGRAQPRRRVRRVR